MMSIRLVSLNIEYDKHLDRVEAFLAKHKPDVVCLQELYERDAPRFAAALGGAAYRFEPMTIHGAKEQTLGVGIFSRWPIRGSEALYYRGTPDKVPRMIPNDWTTFQNKNQMVLFGEFEREGALYKIGTTHFTWTFGGLPDEEQRKDFKAMTSVLEQAGEFVLAGDFNAPRGGEIFSKLAARYKDNIPARYETSLDVSLHREGRRRPEELKKMVDGLFSTPRYAVSDAELVAGVSDHMAVCAAVSLRKLDGEQ